MSLSVIHVEADEPEVRAIESAMDIHATEEMK